VMRRSAAAAMLGVLAWWTSAGASAQTVPVPNPSFEEGGKAPAGWNLSGGRGEWLAEGAAHGRRAVAVTGTGSDSGAWLSPPLPLEPGGVYLLEVEARALEARGGTAVVGPLFCNRDLGPLPDRWQAYSTVFVAPSPLDPGRARLRLGQWHVRGTVAYDRVRLCRVRPVYARRGEVVLGEGEMVRGAEYTFRAPFDGVSRNHARPLVRFTAGFNSNRWVFGVGQEVVYRHQVPGRRQTRAEVTVDVTWHAAGRLVVEVSADGKTWRRLGDIDRLASRTWSIPADLLAGPPAEAPERTGRGAAAGTDRGAAEPGRALWVRLRAEPSAEAKRASLQVGGYAYRAELDAPVPALVGRTDFVAVERADPRLRVRVLSLGDAVPRGRNRVVLEAVAVGKAPVRVTAAAWVGAAPEAPAGPATVGAEPRLIRLPYDLPGPGEHLLRVRLAAGGAPLFEARVPLQVASLHTAGYGERLPASTEAVGLWWCPSGWKVSRRRGLPEAAGEAVRLSAARNETDAAQVVVRPARPLRGLVVETTDLVGPEGARLPASAVEVLRVRYVLVTRPTDSAGCVGWWPDPLPPIRGAIDLEADRNQPLWVRVTVPKSARAGAYRGAIRLAAEGWSAEVPLRLRVFDFTLPDRLTCQTAFGLNTGNIWRYHGLRTEADRRAVLEKYLETFSAHHISPYNPAPLDPIRVTWPKGARKGDREPLPPERIVPRLDFSAWDRAMSRAIDHFHFNSFMVRIPGMGGGSFHARREPSLLGWSEETPQYRAAFTAYCRLLEAHLRQKGWLRWAYVYWFDEPAPKDYAFVMNGFRTLKEAAPGLTRMLTEQPEPALYGGPNLWCPVSHNYDHARAEARRALGERFWWYVCCGPKAPYAGLFIDHPATELRVWLWQTWKRRIEGVLIWSANYWTSSAAYPDPDRPQNPYEDPMGWVSGYSTAKGVRRPWGNGDGRFLYPPESCADGRPGAPVLDGPVDSLRWEMLRDGLEDYEYLAVLKRLLAEKADRLSAGERAAYRALLEVPETITRDMTHFTTDPAPIEARRREVAEAIERLRRL